MAQSKQETKILEERLSKGLKWSSFQWVDLIDSGTSGHVYIYANSDEQGKNYACKVIKVDGKVNLNLEQEIKILEQISSGPEFEDFATSYYGFVHYTQTIRGDQIREFYALLFELADGTLKTLLEKEINGISFSDSIELINTISQGMSKLQEMAVAHRDIKPSNILYFNKNGKIIFKMTDFGEAKLNFHEVSEGTLVGTPIYLSPELNYDYLKNRSITKNDFFRSDVYSFGLSLIYAFLKRGPFENSQRAGKRRKERKCNPRENNKGPYDEKIEECIEKIGEKFKNEKGRKILKRILRGCLKYNPQDRLEWSEIKGLAKKLKEKAEIKENDGILRSEIDLLRKAINSKDQIIRILSERTAHLMKCIEEEIYQMNEAERKIKDLS